MYKRQYLFCGTRGTGKTTAAKVLSRAVNCLHPVDGDPCGACDVCVQLKKENNLSLIHIYWQFIIKGVVILGAVYMDFLRSRKRAKG